ncbi:hypothetical protein NDU88_004321 [Pleurodeles waltl]|uniref:Uncharacterized protein n=1 Tax=Pleurodeles waltl TaxID=8319 RepID=A0AAV7WVJ3_PLEWA|nr:hypothetical protein NDU88_004321 [Pleurodeles waltl]
MYGREARFPCEVPEELIIDAYLGKLCMSRPHVLHCDIRNGLFRNIPGPLPLVSFPFQKRLKSIGAHLRLYFSHCITFEDIPYCLLT